MESRSEEPYDAYARCRGEGAQLMKVTLLYFEGCPHWDQAKTNLLLALSADEFAGCSVNFQTVESADEADRLGFTGSPTILLDGVDPFAVSGTPPALSCRMYRTTAGLAGAPTVAQLRAALRQALR
jgi:hypothetical protein